MSATTLLIFGASRNTGLHIARLARQQGFTVQAMLRPESDCTALHELGVETITGDAFSFEDCCHAMKQAAPDLVVSTLGGKNAAGRRIDAIGNINLIRAALACKCALRHFVLMTSMGCSEEFAASSEKVKKYLGEALLAKTEAENALKQTSLPWTIVRPGGLANEPATNDWKIADAPAKSSGQYLSRADVAAAIIELLDDSGYLRRVVNILNASGT